MSTDGQQENADATAAKVGALAALYASGTLDRPQFVEAFVLIVHAAKIRAARLAEVWLWRWSLTNWPEPIEPLGLIPDPEVADVLRAAVETITEPETDQDNVDEFQARTIEEISRGAVSFRSGVEIVNRAERVGRDAALESGRETAQQRMQRQGVESWVWVAQPDACEECARRHGNVYSIEVTFRDHPQCSCHLEPATPEQQAISERKRAAAIKRREHDAAELDDPAGAAHGSPANAA